jgi:hypothetical protein
VIGEEYRYIDPDFIAGGHVINLAGGADILRMVFDFPKATHFHINDIAIERANSDFNVVLEFMSRVENLAPELLMDIVAEGFLPTYRQTVGWRSRGPSQRAEASFYRTMRTNPALRRPLVIKARWHSPSLGPQEKFFYFHPIDILSSIESEEMMAFIPRGNRLVGLLLHNGLRYDDELIERRLAPAYFDRLERGGSYTTGFATIEPEEIDEFLGDPIAEIETLLSARFTSKRLLYRGIGICKGVILGHTIEDFENTYHFSKK